MDFKFLRHHPFTLLYRGLGAMLLLLLILEGWRYIERPRLDGKKAVISQKLEEATGLFLQKQQSLLQQTQNIAGELQNQLEQDQPRANLLETLQEADNIWGAALFQGTRPVVWHGYSLDLFQQERFSTRKETYISVQKQANVVYWQCHVSFERTTGEGPVIYHLYTARRIKQTNALPFADEQEYSLVEALETDNFYRLNLNIYNPLPDTTLQYSTLRTIAGDSVGTVYASTDNFKQAQLEWKAATRLWRASFALIFFIMVSILLYAWVDTQPSGTRIALQLFIIGIGWLVFDYISLAEYWIPSIFEEINPELVSSYQALCAFLIDGLFFLLTTLTIQRSLKGERFQFKATWFMSSIFVSAAAGMVNMAGITLVFQRSYQLVLKTQIPLLTLQIFPSIDTIILYLALGIMLCALSVGLLSINLFLFRSCRDQVKLAAAISIASFTISLFLAQLFFLEGFNNVWAFFTCLIFFAFIFLLSFFLYDNPLALRRSSPLRSAAVASFILSVAGSAIIYNARIDAKDNELMAINHTYSNIQNEEAEKLVNNILSSLEREFHGISEEDLKNRISYVQTRFTQTIESILNTDESLYSFDLQFIRPDFELIADYSTDLNSPNWVDVFDLRRLQVVAAIQQLSKNSVHPVFQEPKLADAENYQTFYRGWIPIFGTNENDPVAWILCSVYKERPNFNKPMRAVMASLAYRDWSKTFAIQQYKNNKLQQISYQGVGDNYPVYNILQRGEVEALKQDSVIYYTSSENGNSYRNLLISKSGERATKITTKLPDYQNILFSFFRLSFTLLLVGFIFLIIYLFIKNGHIVILGKNDQFQYRILDSFLLATLLFLIILVLATHFAISQQNQELVKQELTRQLESITRATENTPSIRRKLARGAPFSLDSLTTSLNVDASFYADAIIKKSTTPQIYQQHLLPSALPFSVYQDLYQSQKRNALTTVMLDNQELVIGYRSVMGSNRNPQAVIAIPTFVQSPKYDQQLLETTSYLIILYLIVFGLFILATTVISRHLTLPLQYIRQGLNKISKGDLDTTIPVTSKDEIGSLAIAYNQMVDRLKELQEELAVAEREAAWQEMAQQVAHEIKNPLTPMKLNIQHLERQLASGDYSIEELKEKIRTITKNLIIQIQSLNNIASDFSKFSKPLEDEAFSSININALINSVSELYQHDDKIIIRVHDNAHPPTVWGVQDDLRRVVINLVKNAREAMPRGGTITLSTYQKNGSIFLEVDDNGNGISEEDKPRIFVPNFSTKSSGTGLGLAICKKVIEAHGGSISFASIQGEGTTFIIKLPLTSISSV